jgi:hypothetical protein
MESLRRRCWAVVVHGAFLAAAVIWLQRRRLALAAPEAGALEAISLAGAEVGVVLLFEALWLGTAGLVRGKWTRRLWTLGLLNGHLLFYLAALLDNRGFEVAGSRSSGELMSYLVDNAEMLGALMFQLLSLPFLVTLAAAPLWMLLAAVIGERTLPWAPRPRAAAGAALLGLALPWGALAAGGFTPLKGASLFADAALGFHGVRYTRARVAEARARIDAGAAEQGYYQAPTLRGPPERQPNVLVLILESTRADRFPWVDAPEDAARAPNLAALAAQSVAFTDTYAGVTHTSKALVSLLCGVHPRLNMAITEAAPGGLPARCLPQLLGEAGWRSLFVQPALGAFEDRPGLIANMGFERGLYKEDLDALAPGAFEHTGYFGLDEYAALEPALGWLEEGEGPWLLALLTASTHHPFQAPGRPSPRDPEDEEPSYLEALAYVDGFIGELMGRLEAGGYLEDTLIVVVGDHGEAFGEHGRRYHNIVPYQEGVRVPLLLSGPGVGPPRVDGALRSQVDLLPTVLALVGQEWEGALPGRSLLGEGRAEALSSCWLTDYCLALVQGDRKTIYHYGYHPTQVFDLAADPGETVDLAPGMTSSAVQALEDRALGLQASISAIYPP